MFETIAVVKGIPRLWERHMARLQAGARRLNIGMVDSLVLLAEARRAIGAEAKCVLKIVVTRAGEGRGYRGASGRPGIRVLRVFPYPVYPDEFAEQGIRVRVCHTRIGHSPALAGMKHLGRLEQVLARSEWRDETIAEGLMCDLDGCVIEGTQSNLFVERNGTLITPDLSAAGIPGIVRGLVMDTAVAHGQMIPEVQIRIDELLEADAMYLTNSLIGIWRVREFAGREYSLSGPAHPIVNAAMERVFGS